MMSRTILCIVFLSAHVFGQSAASVASPAAAQALVGKYCVACHNDTNKTAGVSLKGIDPTSVGTSADTWEKVLRKVRTEEMPPLGLPRPKPDTTASFVNWLESELDHAAIAKPDPGSPSIHRLNRAEYANAVRDLLGVDLADPTSLPPDDSGYGFDNIGEVLTVSPLHMEKYMSTARKVTRLAIGTAKSKPAVEKYPANSGANGETGGELPINEKAGLLVRRFFPADAEYSVTVRIRGNPTANMPVPKMDVRVDGKRFKILDLNYNTAEEAQQTRSYEFRLPLTAGTHEIAAGLLGESIKAEGGVIVRSLIPVNPIQPPSVDYILIGGPFDATGPGNTETRERIFTCRPKPGQSEDPCARKIISTLTRRAYRRPVTAADTAPLMKLFASGRQAGKSFDAGIEMAMRAMLVSPSFLFRVEQPPRGSTPGSIYRISDLELASRLSFFLWSTIPDDELLRLAQQGKLRPALDQQVRRMLADPKAKALVENFAGQWLHLRNVSGWRPDPDKYKNFDEPLRFALQRETEMLFQFIIREDRSVLEFINADYSFLNERLARHYGIDGVRGGYFRRVNLTGPERGGGILTHGSILTVTSYPTRTSPVLRGKWILENVLGAPPPPPPPDVPTLADNAEISAKDLRKALEQHRANAACASCHSRLDPLGFALENYDPTGKYRDNEGGAEIDSSSSLPGGATFRGAQGLKQILMERHDQFVECLSEKLLTYALGRGLEHYDLPAVRQIRRETSDKDYRFSALALAVVNSVPFQQRRTPER